VSDTDDKSGIRWVSYDELASIRAISKKSAFRMANRRKWERRKGNDGTVRVAVPTADLHARPQPNSDDRSDDLSDIRSELISEKTATISALQGTIALLRDQLDRERTRADQADARATRAEARTDAAETRADLLRDKIDELQTALEAARAARKAEGRISLLPPVRRLWRAWRAR
jgi:hypothetical protein